MSMWIFFCSLLMCVMDYIGLFFWLLNQLCVFEINPIWSQCIIFLYIFRFDLLTFFNIVTSIFLKDTGSFSCKVFGFGIRVRLASWNEYGSIPSGSNFWKKLERICNHFSHKCLVEFTCEPVWYWCFLFGKVINYVFNFFNNYMPIQNDCVFLSEFYQYCVFQEVGSFHLD